MSPSVTRFGERFGTSTPTACLPGIGARIRISVVASAYERSSFSAATFVARDPRAGDLSDDRRLHAEMRERLHQRRRGALRHVGRELVRGGCAPQDVPVWQLVLLVTLDPADVEQRRLVGTLRRPRFDEQRRRLVLADDVRIVVHCVHRRLARRSDGDYRRGPGRRLRRERASCTAVSALHGMTRAADECARRRAREQQRPDYECEDADDQRARGADEQPEELLEAAADRAAVRRAERCQEPECRHDQPGPEGAHVDEGAPGDHQRADGDEGDRCDVGGRSDRARESVGDHAAGHPPAPAQVEDGREEDAERQEPEPDELVVLCAPHASLASPLLHARRHAWPERPLLTALCHAPSFAAGRPRPTRTARR